MKAERRHELETNDLAKKIIQAPDYLKLYGGRVLLGVVIFAAALMLVNYRMRAKRENLAAAQNGIATARDAVTRLGMLDVAMTGQDAEVIARQRQLMMAEAGQGIDTVNERSEDPQLLAQAALLRGDLMWEAANLHELPEAATRPALAVDPKADIALEQAESAYRRVLDGFADQSQVVTSARFGLAAVAENRGKWAEARQQYEAIKGMAGVSEALKNMADARLRLVARSEKGVYLARPVQVGATTQSATTTAGTTRPAEAGTGAVSRPVQ